MNSKDVSLSEELPYWEFFDGKPPHAVMIDGSLVAGLQVQPRDIEAFDDEAVNQFTLGLRAALNSVSEGTTLQFVFSVGSDFSGMIQSHIQGKMTEIHPLVAAIADRREKDLLGAQSRGELYRPQLSIFVKAPMQAPKRTSFLKRREIFTEHAALAYADTMEVLQQNIEALTHSFQCLGLLSRTLAKQELIEQVYRYLNPARSNHEPSPALQPGVNLHLDKDITTEADWLSDQTPRSQLVFGDLLVGFDQFTLDSKHHRVISLKTLPEVTCAGQLSNFLRLPFHYDLVLSVEVPPQALEMTRLQQKRKMAHSMATTHGGRASDLESETKLSSTEELIRELLSTGQRIYAAEMLIILRADANGDGTKELNRKAREVLSRIRTLQGAEALEETVGAWKVFKGNLPVAPLAPQRTKKMKTNNLADFLPVYGPREGDQDPVVIFRNRMNGLVAYDDFSPELPNFNVLVTGSSGAGKSFINNCILLQELARGRKVYIIDIGGSYRKLTHALDGQYLEVNLSEAYRLNPFDLPNGQTEPSNQKLKSLLAVIELMVSEDDNSKLAKLDRALLERSLIEVYRSNKVSGRPPTLSDLAMHLSKLEEDSMQSISKMLYLWTGDRPYGKLLDGQGSLRTDASICTFDLKGLSAYPDLQGVMLLILTSFILDQVEGDRTTRKKIILDEAWELLKSPSAANFMEYCARTLRKSGSGITFITQGVSEIEASPIGSAILNNTATKLVMLQRGDSQVLSRVLKLNPQEEALIQSLKQKKGEYSEGFLIEGDHRQVIRIHPTPFEYWLSTSDAQDNRYLDELQERGFSLVSAIESAATDYPGGVAAGRTNAGTEVSDESD